MTNKPFTTQKKKKKKDSSSCRLGQVQCRGLVNSSCTSGSLKICTSRLKGSIQKKITGCKRKIHKCLCATVFGASPQEEHTYSHTHYHTHHCKLCVYECKIGSKISVSNCVIQAGAPGCQRHLGTGPSSLVHKMSQDTLLKQE